MKLDITSALNSEGEHFSFAVSSDSLEGESGFEFSRPLEINGSYVYEHKLLTVAGHVSTSLAVNCSRCLRAMEYPVELDFTAVFAKQPEEKEEQQYSLDGSSVLLDKPVADEISLSLPYQYLCKADCKGLCPVCGADRNEVECGCDTEIKKDNPFAQLKGLFD